MTPHEYFMLTHVRVGMCYTAARKGVLDTGRLTFSTCADATHASSPIAVRLKDIQHRKMRSMGNGKGTGCRGRHRVGRLDPSISPGLRNYREVGSVCDTSGTRQ